MTPCPCGYYGDPRRACSCAPGAIGLPTSRRSVPVTSDVPLSRLVGIVTHESQLLGGAESETRVPHRGPLRSLARTPPLIRSGHPGRGSDIAATIAPLSTGPCPQTSLTCARGGEAERRVWSQVGPSS